MEVVVKLQLGTDTIHSLRWSVPVDMKAPVLRLELLAKEILAEPVITLGSGVVVPTSRITAFYGVERV